MQRPSQDHLSFPDQMMALSFQILSGFPDDVSSPMGGAFSVGRYQLTAIISLSSTVLPHNF